MVQAQTIYRDASTILAPFGVGNAGGRCGTSSNEISRCLNDFGTIFRNKNTGGRCGTDLNEISWCLNNFGTISYRKCRRSLCYGLKRNIAKLQNRINNFGIGKAGGRCGTASNEMLRCLNNFGTIWYRKYWRSLWYELKRNIAMP